MHKTRLCYKCGFKLNYIDFITSIHAQGIREMFTLELLWEIWKNPIFILQCCSCHLKSKCDECGRNVYAKFDGSLCYFCYMKKKWKENHESK